MTTRLTYKEFESRLTDLTRIGQPTIMGTPFAIFTIFDFSGKPFYGVFDNSKFQLARNKVFPLPSGYIVNGTYSESDNKTILNYVIKPIAFAYYWIRTAPMLFFLFINAVLFFDLRTFRLDVILTLNGFVLLMTILSLTVDRFQKREINKRFQEEFGVEY